MFSHLFDQADLLPHSICLFLRPDLLWLHAGSDLATALAYYSIPFALLVLAWRRRDLQFRWMLVLFGLFILACGTTHLMALWTLWIPAYGIAGLVKVVTAVTSVATAILLWPLIPRILELPSPGQWRQIHNELRAEISERMAAETRTRELNSELERRVAERTAELAALNDRLTATNGALRVEIEDRKKVAHDLAIARDRAKEAEAKAVRAQQLVESANREKARFLASASHDLRQPAQAISFLTTVLEERLASRPEADTVAVMRQSVDEMEMLLGAYVDVSRLDAGMIVPEPRLVDIRQLLWQTVEHYSPSASAKKLRLRVLAGGALVRTDAALLERVLGHVMENAIKFTVRGGILLGCRRRGETWRIDVIDTGVGISEPDQAAIFQEFYQVGNPQRDRRLGLGLGLAIVQRLTILLGIVVEVRSRPEKGSRFSFLLPATQGQETTATPTA